MTVETATEKVVAPTTMTTTAAVLKAREIVYKAETLRREPNGSFSSSAVQGAHPDSDWGVAAQLIRAAEAHLDEALPNGQQARAEAALGALILGVALLTRDLAARGVHAGE